MKKIFAIISLLFLTSCSHYVINSQGFVRPPKNYKFSYRNKSAKLKSNETIDTTAIYYFKNSNYYRDSQEFKSGGRYVRFYANGKFKMQGTKTYPSVEDINNTERGVVGYYKLKKNVVKLQIYGDIDGGSDMLEFGLIDENKNLILLDENPRTYFRIGYSENGIRNKIKYRKSGAKIYEKKQVEGITYEKPNW